MANGNNSKESATWICGPRHSIRQQRIPGYTGFISGMTSENVFSKSYAKATSKSLAGRVVTGADLAPNNRYVSQNAKAFSPKNFRRIVERPDLDCKRDYLEYTKAINFADQGNK
jgi:hypothetical protein